MYTGVYYTLSASIELSLKLKDYIDTKRNFNRKFVFSRYTGLSEILTFLVKQTVL